MGSSKKYSKIEELLTDKMYVREFYPSLDDVIRRIDSGEKLRLIYGETYDAFGLTIDSLKYYFFISLLHRRLENAGVDVASQVIIGDVHSVKNNVVKDKERLLVTAKEMMDKFKCIKEIYGLAAEPVLMSSLLEKDDFVGTLERVNNIFNKSSKYRQMAEKTVLKNRLAQERKVNFQYTVEEVALILDHDIKIGPPRERQYDEIARSIGQDLGKEGLCGIYLCPTYPLGMKFDYFVQNPEVEKYGVTPYKAGSNRLQKNRIIIGKSTKKEVERLVNDSFLSPNIDLPNPVIDLFLTTMMARYFLEGNYMKSDYDSLRQDSQKLKEITIENAAKYILNPLN